MLNDECGMKKGGKHARRPCTRLVGTALAALCAVGAAVVGQAQPAPAPAPDPTTAPATAPALTPVAPVDYPDPSVLTAAARQRLSAERVVFEQELLDNAVYDLDEVKKAAAAMKSQPRDTPQDNRQRFATALAALDPRFGKAWTLYQAGNWGEASDAFAPLIAEKVKLIKARRQHNTMLPISYCTTKFLYAECLGRVGNLSDTIVAYQIVFEKLPDSVTFAPAARMRAAIIYEQTGRPFFAVPIYKLLKEKFADMLIDAEDLRLTAKIDALTREDPFRLAAGKMNDVGQRLARADVGRPTQQAQAELMPLLSEMMAIAEAEDRPFLEHTDAIQEGAETGKLQTGSSAITAVGANPEKVGGDDWGLLRPREKQQLIQAFNEAYPERYRDMIEAYYKNLADAENESAAPGPKR